MSITLQTRNDSTRYNMGLGESPFPVCDEFKLNISVLSLQSTYRYGPNLAKPNFVAAFVKHLQGSSSRYSSPESTFPEINILSTKCLLANGSKENLFTIFYVLKMQNYDIYTTKPIWSGYLEIARLLCFDFNFVSDIVDVPPRSVFLVNSPNNPSGEVLSCAEVSAISTVANEKNIIVLSDEIYRNFSYVSTSSFINFARNYIISSSVSKNFHASPIF